MTDKYRFLLFRVDFSLYSLYRVEKSPSQNKNGAKGAILFVFIRDYRWNLMVYNV